MKKFAYSSKLPCVIVVMFSTCISILMFLLTFNYGELYGAYSDRSLRINHDIKEKLNQFRIKRKEAFIVTPPFEMNTFSKMYVTPATVSNEASDEAETNIARPDNDDNIYDKSERHKKDYDSNEITEKGAMTEREPLDDNENMNLRNTYSLHTKPVNNMDIMMQVISKQNDLVKKIIALYKAEIKQKQFQKILNSVHKKNNKQLLRQAKDGTSPGDDGTSPGDDSTSPGNGDTSPSNGDTSPGNGDTSPSNGDTSPSNGDTSPGNGDTSPGNGDTSPGNGDTSPSNGDTSPGNGDTSPSNGDTSPGNGDTSPSNGDTSPGNGDTSPSNGDTSPGNGDTSPSNGDTSPGNGDTSPSNDDTTPISTEKTPSSTDTTPSSTDTTPSSADTTPSASSQTDAGKRGMMSIVRIDEAAIKRQLVKNPFVRRILNMAQKKREEYINRRRQEMALQRKGYT
ncbi:putative mediator of RNA polymerase II transcription subunit 26 [Cydia splendana]|uniref:putative mediator of RNA polymerase II transcription subunit 26 n=1 Tax=Cydia splendana TaxID=1100963 RepID=UPI0028F490C4